MNDSLVQTRDWFALVVVAAATWRIAYMLISERGPFDLIMRVRTAFGVWHDSETHDPMAWPDGSIFACLFCMSVWVGLVLCVLPWWVSLPFALSGIAIALDATVARLNVRANAGGGA